MKRQLKDAKITPGAIEHSALGAFTASESITLDWGIDCVDKCSYLKTLFECWQDEKGYEDFRKYRMAAKEHCPGLTELWDQPFQAVYRYRDGSRIIVRFKQTEEGTEIAVDTLTK